MPLDLATQLEKTLAHSIVLMNHCRLVMISRGPVAFLVELHRMRDRPGIAEQIAAFSQQLHDSRPRLDGRQAGELVVLNLRTRGVHRLPSTFAPDHRTKRAIGKEHRADRQGKLAPPHHVGDVAERRSSRRRSFSGSANTWAFTGTRTPNNGVMTSVHRRAVDTRIVGMRDDRDAGRNQLGTGRRRCPRSPSPVGRTGSCAYAPGISRSSSSAWATAVRKSTSHSVGASS